MDFIKNKVKESWDDQAFFSNQMDGVKSWLVALEKVATSFSHFILEHWIPSQAVLIDLHNATCPTVRGWMEWLIMGIGSLSPSNLVWPLQFLSLHQTLDKGIQLPSLVLSPPLSTTPPPAQLCHSSLQELANSSKKHQAILCHQPLDLCPIHTL